MKFALQKAVLVVAIAVSWVLVWVSHQILGTGVLLRSIGLLDCMAMSLVMFAGYRMFRLAVTVAGIAVVVSGLEVLVFDRSDQVMLNAAIVTSAGMLAIAASDFGRGMPLVREEFLSLLVICLISSADVVWTGQSLVRTWICFAVGLVLFLLWHWFRLRRGSRPA